MSAARHRRRNNDDLDYALYCVSDENGCQCDTVDSIMREPGSVLPPPSLRLAVRGPILMVVRILKLREGRDRTRARE